MVIRAVVGDGDVLVEVLRDHIEAVESVSPARLGIILPVRAAITDSEPAKFVCLGRVVNTSAICLDYALEVGLIDLPREHGHINAAVALTSDEDLVLKEAGELYEEALKSGKCVLSLGEVVVLPVSISGSLRITDTGGRLEPHHVGAHVPRVRILIDGASSVVVIIDNPRSVLLEEAQHARAARATVEPDNERVISRITHRLGVHVMQLFATSIVDVQIPGVGVRREGDF